MQVEVSMQLLALLGGLLSSSLVVVWRIAGASEQMGRLADVFKKVGEHDTKLAVHDKELESMKASFTGLSNALFRCQDKDRCFPSQSSIAAHDIVDAIERLGTPLHEHDLASRVLAQEAERMAREETSREQQRELARLPFLHHKVLPPISEAVSVSRADMRREQSEPPKS